MQRADTSRAGDAPGLELRTRRVGELLDAAIRLTRRAIGPILPMIVAVEVPIAVIAFTLLSITDVSTTTQASLWTWLALLVLPMTLLLGTLSIPAMYTAYLGTPISGFASLKAVARRLPRLIGYSMLAGLIYSFMNFAVSFVLVFAIGIAVKAFGFGNQWVTALIGIVGILAWTAVFWGLVTRALTGAVGLIVERTGVFESFSRGWALTRGQWLRYGLLYVATTWFSAAIGAAVLTLTSALLPKVQGETGKVALSIVYALVGGAVYFPFLAALAVTVFVDGRIRTEAMDLELLARSLRDEAPTPRTASPTAVRTP